MKILDFLNHINQNQRGKLVNFIQRYDFHNTKLELVSGQLAATIQDDAGTLSLAICCQHIPYSPWQTGQDPMPEQCSWDKPPGHCWQEISRLQYQARHRHPIR